MVLQIAIEVGGELVDGMSVDCEIVDNENAVAAIGDVPDVLTFRATILTAVIDGVEQELWTAPVTNND